MTALLVLAFIAFVVVMVLRAIPNTSRGPDRNPRRRTHRETNDDRDVLWYVPWSWSIGDGDGDGGGGDGGGDGGGGD